MLNAANEVAVSAFLAGRLPFTAIADVVEKCLTWLGDEPVESLDDVFACDAEARRFAAEAAGATLLKACSAGSHGAAALASH